MARKTKKLGNEMIEPPRLGAAQVRLLERLCNACAVSGDEGEVRAIVLEQIRPLVDDLRVDALGNILATRPWQRHRLSARDAGGAYGRGGLHDYQ